MSKNRYAGRRKGGRKWGLKDPFEKVTIHIPKSTMSKLRNEADSYKVPVELLILRGITYSVECGEYSVFVARDFYPDAGRSTVEDQQNLFQVLCRLTLPINVEMLYFASESLGFRSVHHLANALSDLLVMGLAERLESPETGTMSVRAIRNDNDKIKKTDRYTAIAGEKL